MDRMMYFGLNYLRYIIVLTQLVVIGVFFYRFQIDQKIIELREAVDQKKEIIEIVLPLLQQASKIDKKTKEIEKILHEQNRFNAITSYFLSSFPKSITLTNFEMKKDSITIIGNATDIKEMQSFYALLKKEGKFSEVNLKNFKRTDTGYYFVLDLNKWRE